MNENRNREKIAFVCQRYGPEVNGGSEQYCRQIAERLAGFYDVTVYTTCATDYMTWANRYAPGEETINGVRVKRYSVPRERRRWPFRIISALVKRNPWHTDAAEERWVDAQGPYCPDLIDALRAEHRRYKAVLFMTYLYYTTVRGIALDIDNAILIPTLHDEPTAYLRCYGRVFGRAGSIAWNSPEERAFALKRFPFLKDTPGAMTGLGIDVPEGALPPLPEGLEAGQYLVYAGRIDRNKGCAEMLEMFRRYKRERGGDLKLVLMGKAEMPLPDAPDIVPLGYVPEATKYAVMAGALALTLFSRFESLSIVVLESMAMGRPVLVTGHSEVLKGHCDRSGAGLYFMDYPEFARSLDRLLAGGAAYAQMREKGRRYVEENYRWNVIVDKYRALIERAAEGSRASVQKDT